jgi:hypothetical protein
MSDSKIYKEMFSNLLEIINIDEEIKKMNYEKGIYQRKLWKSLDEGRHDLKALDAFSNRQKKIRVLTQRRSAKKAWITRRLKEDWRWSID